MYKKIARILGVVASVAMVCSAFAITTPVAASTPGVAQFTLQDTPGTTNYVILAGSTITGIATGSDGKTVYVLDGVPADYIMKSTDGGASFTNVLNNYATVGGTAPKHIAVAPDDVNTVVVTDASNNVIISKDGGTTWSALPTPVAGLWAADTITGVDVAPARSGTLLGREYVVSLAKSGFGTAYVASTYTASAHTAEVYTASSYTPGSPNPDPADVYTASTHTAEAYTASAYTPSSNVGGVYVASTYTASAHTAEAYTASSFTAGGTIGKNPGTYVASTHTASTYTVSAYTASVASAGGGDVLIIGAGAAWTPVVTAFTGTTDFTSVVFTPNFLGDRSVVAVGTTSTLGSTTVYILNTATNTVIQYAAVNVISGSNTVKVGGGANAIISSSIALPTNFDPTTTSGRRGYIALYSTSAIDNDVYRFDDNSVKSLGAVGGATGLESISYTGTTDTGTLFCGLVTSADVKFTTGMTSTSPTWTTTSKDPITASVTPTVIVKVASDFATSNKVFAGTIGAESGFNTSTDAGVSFNAAALIDTGAGATNWAGTTGSLQGFQYTADVSTIFANVKDGNGWLAVWKSPNPPTTSSWVRVFAHLPIGSIPANAAGLLRLNGAWTTTPALFFFEYASAANLDSNGFIYTSQDGGVSWSSRNPPTGVTTKTALGRDSQTIYLIDGSGSIYKSTNAAWTWTTAVATGVASAANAYAIVLPKANQVIVGGATVAISNDDAATFTNMNSGLPTATNGYSALAADTAYATNNRIYAVDTGVAGSITVYRVTTDNTSNQWESMGVTPIQGAVAIPGTVKVVTIATRSGFLYIVTTGTGSKATGVIRTLYPNDLVGNQNWAALNAGLVNDLSSGGTFAGINVYVRDATASAYAFNDYMASTKPTLTSPADNYNDAVNPSNGNGYSVDLKFSPMGSGTGQVDKADIEIVDKTNGFTGTPTNSAITIAPTNPIINTGTIGFILQPNHTYQWHVRAAHETTGEYADSPWSDARTINVQSGGVVQQAQAGVILQGPIAGATGVSPDLVNFSWAPVSGATQYQIIIATDPGLTKTVVGTPALITAPAYQATGLTPNTPYFWAVQATQPTVSVQSIGTFTTAPKAATNAAGQTTTTGGGQQTIVVSGGGGETPAYIWAVIAIGAILVIAVIILIVRTRRVP